MKKSFPPSPRVWLMLGIRGSLSLDICKLSGIFRVAEKKLLGSHISDFRILHLHGCPFIFQREKCLSGNKSSDSLNGNDHFCWFIRNHTRTGEIGKMHTAFNSAATFWFEYFWCSAFTIKRFAKGKILSCVFYCLLSREEIVFLAIRWRGCKFA